MPALTRRAAILSPAPSSDDIVEETTPKRAVAFKASVPAARPLHPAKTVAGPGPSSANSRRFRVVFSPHLAHTKVFRSEDPSSPASGYETPSSPCSSPSVRGILKRTPTRILIAKTAKEGTWSNREAARRVVAGHKPGPYYSAMVLSEFSDGADEAVRPPSSEDDPGSDDMLDAPPASDGSEEEEEVECLHPSSLISVILDGAEDLLTLEEAYGSLCMRLRDTMFHMGPPTAAAQLRLDTVWQPIAEEAPAVVRAIQRDLSRLMGKVPVSEVDPTSSPFRTLGGTAPPSPSHHPKKGYTAAEILYRRESAGVGSSALRLLAIIFSHARLYSCFSEVDVQTLLDQVLTILRSPSLPTPFAKRTYTLTMTVISALNLPPSWVRPFETKLVNAVTSGLTTIGSGLITIKDPSAIRKESFSAAASLFRRYPDITLPHYQTLLPIIVRAFSSPGKVFRRCGVAAAGAFVSAKLGAAPELRPIIAKSETFVSNFLKSYAKRNGKICTDDKGDKKTEGCSIMATIKATMGDAKDVAWSCTAWAVLASLIGHAYNASQQLHDIDFIMERSLGASTNTIRPTLATAAWLHGVHAYLHAGSSVRTDDGQAVYSYNPFLASSHQDVNGRLKTIMAPTLVALTEAVKPENVARSLLVSPEFNDEQRWKWERGEKPKKFAWMVTVGMSAPSIVYAYTVASLAEEAAAPGMLSSDTTESDLSLEERRIPRLDRTFELVLHPLLKRMFTICGVDDLKTAGWEMLAAITAGTPSRVPSLDRMLSKRLLDADIISLEDVGAEARRTFESERITADEIPGWGRLWVAKRLGKLLALFQAAFDDIRGINDLGAVEWVTNKDGLVLLPRVLSTAWENMLKALADTREAPTPLYALGLRAVATTLVHIFDKDPATCIPICLLNAEGQSTLDADAIRLGITLHLYTLAVEILGEKALGGVRIDIKVAGVDEPAFTANPIGHPTVAGHLLGHLVSWKHFPSVLDPKVSPLFTSFVSALLDSGSYLGTTLLGDLSNKIPFIFQGCERLQLDVWRILALKWASVVDLEPQESAGTNYTGDLLTTLLSCPFRNMDDESVWYTSASSDDLDAWDSLLKTTVLRFRAKRAGSNLGVMETLAAHLGDFVAGDDAELTHARRACTTTLYCLAKALTWISLVPKEHHHADHYGLNENYPPTDFFSFLGGCLVDAYGESDVGDVVDNLTTLFANLPDDAVEAVVAALRPGLAIWMTDADCCVSDSLAAKLDAMYITLMGTLGRAIESRAIPASSQTMDAYIELYAPRLSRAQSRDVPTAFQQLWHCAFEPLGAVEYSDDVAGFLGDVLCAAPGFIIADGLESVAESQSVYPYATEVPPQEVENDDDDAAVDRSVIVEVEANAEVEVDEEEEPEPEPELEPEPAAEPEFEPQDIIVPSPEYEADVSQSPTKRAKRSHTYEIIPQSSSPAPTPTPEADVFGLKSSTRRRKNRRPRSTASSPGVVADTTIIADTPLREDIVHAGTPGAAAASVAGAVPTGDSPVSSSLFNVASRWLRRMPSLLVFASSDDMPEAEVDTPSRRRRKRDSDRSAVADSAIDMSDVVDLTRDSPEPEEQASASTSEPTSARALTRTRSAPLRTSRSATPQPTQPLTATASEPVLTRSAARLRDDRKRERSDDDTPRRAKRRRRRAADDDRDSVSASVTGTPTASASAAVVVPESEPRRRSRRANSEREDAREAQRAEQARVEAARVGAEKEAARIEAERVEAERLEAERAEQKRLVQERIEARRQERQEKRRIEQERQEKERIARQRLKEERLEAERLEAERIEAERLEAEREREREEELASLEKEKKDKEEKEASERKESVGRRRKGRGKRRETSTPEAEAAAEPEAVPEPESEPATPTKDEDMSGRFADAPGDRTPRVTRTSQRVASASAPASGSAPNTPARRSRDQKTVLKMLEDAVVYEEAVQTMDMDGLIALMANIDRIRASAIANLQGQAVAARDEVREVRRRRKD